MKIYGGFINEEKCTFNIYSFDCIVNREGDYFIGRSVPTGTLSSSIILEKHLFQNGMTRMYETFEGFVRYSKTLNELEDWLNNYRGRLINDLKQKLEKYEANPVKIIELD